MNTLANDTILGMCKFKTSADEKFGVAEIMGLIFERVENIVAKRENAGYQHFSFFYNAFQRLLTLGRSKLGLCGKELNAFQDLTPGKDLLI